MASVLRHRVPRANGSLEPPAERSETASDEDKIAIVPVLEKGTFWLTRIVILRYIALIYCNA